MLAYNTSYHSTIASMLFEVQFGVKPRLPSLPVPEIEQHHYVESFAAEQLQLLQHARKLVCQTAEQQGQKYKQQLDQKVAPHNFAVGQKVWLSDTTAIGKNQKLTPNWIGPFVNVNLNDNNSKLQLKMNKFKIVNVAQLKAFHEEPTKCLSQDDCCSSESDQHLVQDDLRLSEDSTKQFPDRPITRALKKLTDFKNAASTDVSLINNKLETKCDCNMFAENYNKYHCSNCYHGIRNFAHIVCNSNIFHKDPFNLIISSNTSQILKTEGAFISTLCDLIKNYEYSKK
jgi:hypothetical protein